MLYKNFKGYFRSALNFVGLKTWYLKTFVRQFYILICKNKYVIYGIL